MKRRKSNLATNQKCQGYQPKMSIIPLCPLIHPRGLFSLYDFAWRQNPGYGRRSAERIVASLLQPEQIFATISAKNKLRYDRTRILNTIQPKINLRAGQKL